MEPFVFFAVLAAAALHAGWNAIVKVGLDHLSSVALITMAAGVISLAALPFVDPLRPAAWPWLAVSIAFHTGYKLFLVRAYRTGDLGQVYPIARGAAPLLVCVAMFALGEALSPWAAAGVALLGAGVLLMSIRGGRDLARIDATSVGYALVTSIFIACYTLTDGLGARANGSPHGYAVWLFIVDGITMFLLLMAVRRGQGIPAFRAFWAKGLAGGVMSAGAYWIAIWAMTVAPIALVAALRESSVLFAAAISVAVLREPPTPWRMVAAVVIVAGIVLARTG